LVVFCSYYYCTAVSPANTYIVVKIDYLVENNIIDIIFKFYILTISTLLDSSNI